MNIRPSEVERFVDAPPPSLVAALVFGPDRGLVEERAGRIARAIVPDLSDPFRVADLAEGTLDSDPARLADEAATMAAETAALAGEEAPLDRAAVPQGSLADCLKAACSATEQASAAYLDAADAGRDEEVVRQLHAMAERAIGQVAALRHAARRGR